jgi:hypothetical protein
MVKDEVLAHGKATQSGPQVFAEAADMGIAGDEDKTISDEINEAISDVRAAALPGDVEPDFGKLGYNFRGEAMRHQRRAGCSESKRARPRFCSRSSHKESGSTDQMVEGE